MLEIAHLPGSGVVEAWHEGRTAAGLPFRSPALSRTAAAEVAASVRAAALRTRRERTVGDVVTSIAAAAKRIVDPEDPAGRDALEGLRRTLGWSAGTAEKTLHGMGAGWTRRALEGLLEAELADPLVLDGFRPDARREGRRRRAVGPPLVLQVQAGNVPGVAVSGIVRALLVRSGTLVKLPGDEPSLPALFLRTLADEDPLLAAGTAACWWPGRERPPVFEAWVDAADLVVVYGGAEAVRGVRDAVGPETDLLVYGPRLGVAVLLPDAAPAAAAELARDLVAYEQRGCVSPRLAFSLGHTARGLADRVATALESVAGSERWRPPSPAEAVAIRDLRATWEFAGYGGAESGWLGSDDPAWTVLWREEPSLRAETLPRVLQVHAAPDIPTLLRYLAPLAGRIQALGYAGTQGLDRLAEGAAELGVARVAPLGTMAWPPVDWRHEGRFQLLPLLRWTELEGPAVVADDREGS